MNKTVRSRYDQTQKTEKKFFVCVLFGVLWGVASGVILLTICAFAGTFLEDPEKYAPIMALGSLLVASYVTGYKAAAYKHSGGAGIGLVSGVMFILLVSLSALATASSIKLPLFAICAPVSILVSVFAGIIGGGKKQKAPKKHKIKDF